MTRTPMTRPNLISYFRFFRKLFSISTESNNSFPLLHFIVISFVGLPQLAGAECSQLPNDKIVLEESLKDKFPFASSGVIWAMAAQNKQFDPTFILTSKTKQDHIDFIIVDNATKQPIPSWPYPVGGGLFVGITGTITATSDNYSFSHTYNLPMDPAISTSSGPALISFDLQQPEDSLTFSFSSNDLGLYLICPSGNCDYSKTYTFPKRLTIIPNKPWEYDTEGNTGFVCSGKGQIQIISHCTLQANPTSIRFRDMSVKGIPGTLEQVESTSVSVVCQSGASTSKKAPNIRIYPEHKDKNDVRLARFTKVNGDIFRGIGLVYNIDKQPSCTGSENRLEWNVRQALGDWKTENGDKKSSSTVYWGLCRVDDAAKDVGQYGTTATISFWID